MDTARSAARTGIRARSGATLRGIAIMALAAAACSEAKPAARTHAIAIRGFQYVPPTASVSVGDTIVWTNEDVVPHTATAADRRWDTGSIGSRASGRVVITRKGKQAYICAFHPAMKAELVAE